jgi:hypothetical protein
MLSDFSPRLSRRFSTPVDGGEVGELTREVVKDATVERVDVRFYRGPQLDLEVVPFVERNGATQDGDRVNLIDVEGRESIVGDDDHFSFPISEPIREGDVIGVEYANTEQQYGYDVTVDMVLEREGGLERIVDVFRGGL